MVRVWTIKHNEDELFREYRREYKKRFARIRTGRTTKEEFYAWSEQAREKKEACESGKLPHVEFIEWLKKEGEGPMVTPLLSINSSAIAL